MRKGTPNDPGRKERIRQAALTVISQHGVSGASYRNIAAEAGVGLGSMTYYYPDLKSLIDSAFELLGEQLEPRFGDLLRTAVDQEAAIEVLVQSVVGPLQATQTEMRLFRQFTHYGAQNERFAEIYRRLQLEAREALACHFSETAAYAINALVDGWWTYQSWSGEPLIEGEVRRTFQVIARHLT